MPGLLLVGLISMLLWGFGLGIDHARSLILFLREPPALSTGQRAELHAWLNANAISLNSVEAGSGFEDMESLKGMIVDAPIVALGEASHLNRELYQVKHRMVEFLVSEMDFTVFAIEATFAGALELNDYVLGADGDPERALAALVYPAWNTEEVLAMVNWMREYNSSHEKKVKFYGFDNKPATGSAKAVYRFLRQRDGTHAYDDLLCLLMNPWTARHFLDGPKEKINAAGQKVKALITDLESRQPERAQQALAEREIPAPREWSLILQHARVLQQHLEFCGASSISKASDLRDQSMAQNVRWLMDYEDGAKTILWAANPHVSAMPGGGGMGYHLRRVYGDDMVIIGLLYNRKSSEDLDEAAESAREASRAPEGSVQAVLSEAGLKMAVLDLRSLPKGIISRYFNARLPTGSNTSTTLPYAYDAILFIESTTGARPVRAGTLGTPVTLQAPSNLDFEQIQDGRLKDWKFQGGQAAVEYQTTVSHDQPHRGTACGMIKRVPGRFFGEAFGNISQSIKAFDFRGRKTRLSAAVRVNDGIGYFWLSIHRPGAPAIFRQEIVTSDKWQEYHILAEVPQEASKITFGLAYVGRGAAYIDEVCLGHSS